MNTINLPSVNTSEVKHSNTCSQILKSANIKCFCKQVYNIQICVNLDHLNKLLLIGISNKVMPNLNSTCPQQLAASTYYASVVEEVTFLETASTPMETSKPMLKDTEAKDVDVYLYRSMIGSLVYLTALRPNIMFVDLPFDLEAYTDSDYAGASLDKKSTTGGCQFLGSRLISWQCKKQTLVATSTTEAEYVAAASCCGQVLWIQNQMMDYGYNYMNTKIFIDIESTICIVKNPVFHSKTKHIEIRHHFIRDSNKKTLIQMIKIHTDLNVTNLVTKAFDVGRFQYLTATDDAIQVSNVGLTYYCTLDNEEMEITATIDGKVKIISEASIRRQETKVPQPSSPPHTNVADEAASTSVDVRHEGAATTVISLDAGQGSIDKTPTMPHDSPLLRVNTLGSDEGRMQHNELMDLVIKLSNIVVALEIGLQQTKKVYGTAFTKFMMKVKKLEKTVKSSKARRRAKIVVSDDEEDLEDPSKQGRKIDEIDQDPDITIEPVSTAGAAITTASVTISTASPPGVSIADDISTAEKLVYIKRIASKDKG
ncbi:hypothetical protein Tco_0729085 [Tanacetum coccineum]|uniref:Uncharacterized protein n=1 Tax=Tanacetum coccineum TaxID=301880 RepID=A0ABQ4YMX5_9ASTR